MREIRTSGSEGGVGFIPHPYLYRGLNFDSPPHPRLGSSRRGPPTSPPQCTSPMS